MCAMGIRPPFFEIGPKNYLVGDEVLSLALAADEAARRYDVDVIFTVPVVDIRRVAERTSRLLVFAPHADPLCPGRGLADTLPESLAAAGAAGAMLNHNERPLTLDALARTIHRLRQAGLLSIVCGSSIAEAAAVARLGPDIVVAEPSELIGSGQTSGMDYVKASIQAVKAVDLGILVLQGAGISSGQDVYDVIFAGAEATGSSSGIVKAADPAAMVDEMVGAVRRAWDDRQAGERKRA